MSGEGNGGPSGVMRRFLGVLTRHAQLGELEADLAELYAEKVRAEGRRAARRWYRGQVWGAAAEIFGAAMKGWVRGPVRVLVIAGQARRRVVRRPSLSIPFAIIVGLGIAATSFMVQVQRALLHPDLGVGVALWKVTPHDSSGSVRAVRFTWDDVWVRAGSGAGGRLIPVQSRSVTARTGAGPLRLSAQILPPGTLRTLRVPLILGRDAQAPGEAVISHAAWRAWWRGDPGVLGASIVAGATNAQVVGVAGPRFDGVLCCVRADLWLAPSPSAEVALGSAVAIDVRDAAAAAASFRSVLRERDPGVHTVTVDRADEAGFGGEQNIVGRILAALVLLAALAWFGTVLNAAHLLLADVAGRGREFRLRSSLGAGSGAAALQLVLELVWLSLAAAAVALVLTPLLLALSPLVLPVVAADSVFDLSAGSPSRLVVAMGAAATVLLCGVPAGAAAVALSRRGGVDRGPARNRASAVVLGFQVCIATALMAVAIELGRTVSRLDGAFVGFRSARTAAFVLAPAGVAGAPEPVEPLLARLSTSGSAATLTRHIPLFGAPEDTIRIEGSVALAAAVEQATLDYFDVIGARVIAGRPAGRDREAVISEDLAQRAGMTPSAALGATLTVGDEALRIVGVVEAGTWGRGRPRPVVVRGWAPASIERAVLLISPAGVRAPALASIASLLAGTTLAVSSVGTLGDLLTRSRVLSAFMSRVGMLFAALCLIVASFGIHAHVLRWARARERELGIHYALGAAPLRLRGRVVNSVLTQLGAGLVAGGLASVIALRLLAALLGTTASSVVAGVAGAVALVAATALAAALIPALRPLHGEPITLLRD